MAEDDKKVIKGAVKQRQKLIGVAVISSDILQTNQRGLAENYLLKFPALFTRVFPSEWGHNVLLIWFKKMNLLNTSRIAHLLTIVLFI